jgi:hypothetical protein
MSHCVLATSAEISVLDEGGELIRHLTLDPSIDYQPRGRTTLSGFVCP